MEALPRSKKFAGRTGPVVLVIMDGVGIGRPDETNAMHLAKHPTLDMLHDTSIHTILRAHGTAVGLPSDKDMGNSEVGHNAMGAGRTFDQGAKLVNEEIESGRMFKTELWDKLTAKPISGDATLHLIGLLSDGNVHSHIDHLIKIIDTAAGLGVAKLRVHPLLDGRDVPATSSLLYIEQLEKALANSGGSDYRIASGGGRMVTTMDRYEADWNIVKRGWDAHVLGKARPFKSAREAIETFRQEDEEITDQYLPSFTIVDESGPVGPIVDGDSVIFFNFRGDRSIEISKAFEYENFDKFDREKHPDVLYAGMMEYDGDLHIPKNFLVLPPAIDKTISEYLVHSGCRQYAISETQKFGHVTYFWNGNRSGKFDEKLETFEEIPSDKVQFDQRPWMKAAEITDRVIEAIQENSYDFIRLNYANGDMVGHTGDMFSSIIAAETVDLCLERLLSAVEDAKGIALITADHGNLDQMYQIDKKTGKAKIDKETGKPAARTAHSLNPVPCIFYDPGFSNEYRLAELSEPSIANVAATLLVLLGYEPPEAYLPSLIELI